MTLIPTLLISLGYESDMKYIKEFLKQNGSGAGGVSNNDSSAVGGIQ